VIGERTPLIKPGVKPDMHKTTDDTESNKILRRAEVGLGRMVELGLPLIMYVNVGSRHCSLSVADTKLVERSSDSEGWAIWRMWGRLLVTWDLLID